MDAEGLKVKIDSSVAQRDLVALENALDRASSAAARSDSSFSKFAASADVNFTKAAKSMEKFAQVSALLSKIKTSGDPSKQIRDLASALDALGRARNIAENKVASIRELSAALSGLKMPPSIMGISSLLSSLGKVNLPTASQTKNLREFFSVISGFKGAPSNAALDKLAVTLGALRAPSKTTIDRLGQMFSTLASAQRIPNATEIARELDLIAASAARAQAALKGIPLGAGARGTLGASLPRQRGAGAGVPATGNAAAGALAGAGAAASRSSGGIIKLSNSLEGLSTRFNLSYQAGTAFTLLFSSFTIGTFVKSIYDSTVGIQKLEKAMLFVTGTFDGAHKATEEFFAISDKLGARALANSDAFGRFAISAKAVGATFEDVKSIYTGAQTALTAVGASAAQGSLAFYGLSQSLGKGKVQSEEYNRQIGEQIPGNVAAGVKALSTLTKKTETVASFFKAMKTNSIDALPFFKEWAKEMEAMFAPLLPIAEKRPDFQLNRLLTTFDKFTILIGKSEFMTEVAKQFKMLADMLGATRNGMGALNGQAETLATTFGHNLASLVRGLGDAVRYLITHMDTVVLVIKGLLAYNVANMFIGWASSAITAASAFTKLAAAATAAAFAESRVSDAHVRSAATSAGSVASSLASRAGGLIGAGASAVASGARSLPGLAMAAPSAARSLPGLVMDASVRAASAAASAGMTAASVGMKAASAGMKTASDGMTRLGLGLRALPALAAAAPARALSAVASGIRAAPAGAVGLIGAGASAAASAGMKTASVAMSVGMKTASAAMAVGVKAASTGLTGLVLGLRAIPGFGTAAAIALAVFGDKLTGFKTASNNAVTYSDLVLSAFNNLGSHIGDFVAPFGAAVKSIGDFAKPLTDFVQSLVGNTNILDVLTRADTWGTAVAVLLAGATSLVLFFPVVIKTFADIIASKIGNIVDMFRTAADIIERLWNLDISGARQAYKAGQDRRNSNDDNLVKTLGENYDLISADKQYKKIKAGTAPIVDARVAANRPKSGWMVEEGNQKYLENKLAERNAKDQEALKKAMSAGTDTSLTASQTGSLENRKRALEARINGLTGGGSPAFKAEADLRAFRLDREDIDKDAKRLNEVSKGHVTVGTTAKEKEEMNRADARKVQVAKDALDPIGKLNRLQEQSLDIMAMRAKGLNDEADYREKINELVNQYYTEQEAENATSHKAFLLNQQRNRAIETEIDLKKTLLDVDLHRMARLSNSPIDSIVNQGIAGKMEKGEDFAQARARLAKSGELAMIQKGAAAQAGEQRDGAQQSILESLGEAHAQIGMSVSQRALREDYKQTLRDMTGLATDSLDRLKDAAEKSGAGVLEFAARATLAKAELANPPGLQRWADSLEPFAKRMEDIKANFMEDLSSGITDTLMGEDVDWGAMAKNLRKQMLKAQVDEGLKAVMGAFGIVQVKKPEEVLASAGELFNTGTDKFTTAVDTVGVAFTNSTDKFTAAVDTFALHASAGGGGSGGGGGIGDAVANAASGEDFPDSVNITPRVQRGSSAAGGGIGSLVSSLFGGDEDFPDSVNITPSVLRGVTPNNASGGGIGGFFSNLFGGGSGTSSGTSGGGIGGFFSNLFGGSSSTSSAASGGGFLSNLFGGSAAGGATSAASGGGIGGFLASLFGGSAAGSAATAASGGGISGLANIFGGLGAGGAATAASGGGIGGLLSMFGGLGAGGAYSAASGGGFSGLANIFGGLGAGGAATAASGGGFGGLLGILGGGGASGGGGFLSSLFGGGGGGEDFPDSVNITPSVKRGASGGGFLSSLFGGGSGGSSGGGGFLSSLFGGGSGASGGKKGGFDLGSLLMNVGVGFLGGLIGDMFKKKAPEVDPVMPDGIIGQMSQNTISATQVPGHANVVGEILKVAANMAISSALGSAGITNGGGGGGTAGGASAALTGGGGLGKQMGVYSFLEGGYSDQPVSRMMGSRSVHDIPRYADGTTDTSGGIPAILHPNEAVIPLSRGRKIPIEGGENHDRPVNVSSNITVIAPNPDAFRKSRGAISRDQNKTLRRAALRNLTG